MSNIVKASIKSCMSKQISNLSSHFYFLAYIVYVINFNHTVLAEFISGWFVNIMLLINNTVYLMYMPDVFKV